MHQLYIKEPYCYFSILEYYEAYTDEALIYEGTKLANINGLLILSNLLGTRLNHMIVEEQFERTYDVHRNKIKKLCNILGLCSKNTQYHSTLVSCSNQSGGTLPYDFNYVHHLTLSRGEYLDK